jgi:tetratricopeptide (TPR) repeat protein
VISEQKEKVLTRFAEGRKYYKLREFEKASACFEDALRVDPADGPSRIYVERCRELLRNPPPEDWDGVYVMKTK